jgi:phage terminase small subunit
MPEETEMGLRGPAPKPTHIRILEGNASRRPLPDNEPVYPVGINERPGGMSLSARRIWDALASELTASGVLRNVDVFALMQLCEDEADLQALRRGMSQMIRELSKKARAQKKELTGGAFVQLSRTIEGRRTISTIRELSASLIVQRREFGLTPSSNSRIESSGGSMDDIDDLLAGTEADFFHPEPVQ